MFNLHHPQSLTCKSWFHRLEEYIKFLRVLILKRTYNPKYSIFNNFGYPFEQEFKNGILDIVKDLRL